METTGAGGASACSEGVACPHAAPYHMVVQLCSAARYSFLWDVGGSIYHSATCMGNHH